MIVDLSDWTPRALPQCEPLEGRYTRVIPTDADRDAVDLFESLRHGDPVLWDYLPYGPFADVAAFVTWLHTHTKEAVLHPRTVVDRQSGKAVGNASYLNVDQANGDIEIGHIFFSAALQRTRMATEAIFLMMRHAFDDLGYRRLAWKCDASNARSMRAAARFGFQQEGVFRQHRIVKGKNRDTAWFSIIDGEWSQVKGAIEEWLDDANFDADGRQVRSLVAVRESLRLT